MLRISRNLFRTGQFKILLATIVLIFLLSYRCQFKLDTLETPSFSTSTAPKIQKNGDRDKCFQWVINRHHEIGSEILGSNRKVILMSTVGHENFGDRFIWVGEELILERLGANVIYRCTTQKCNLTTIESYLTANKDAKICFHGGGNFGDLYRNEQYLKLSAIAKFNQTRAILFPQSIYYRSTYMRDEDIKSLSKHPDLHIMARSKDSIDLLKQHFPQNKNHIFIVDAAFAIGPLPRFCEPQFDVMFFRRRDVEKAISSEYFHEITTAFNQQNISFESIDWPDYRKYVDKRKYAAGYPRDNRVAIHSLELSNYLISRAHVIITDRLHAGVLGLLIDQPVLFIENSYGKLRGVTNVLKEQPACDALRRHFPQSTAEILSLVKMYLPKHRTVGKPCEFQMRPIFPSLIKRLNGTRLG